jgi:hypothetical protein
MKKRNGHNQLLDWFCYTCHPLHIVKYLSDHRHQWRMHSISGNTWLSEFSDWLVTYVHVTKQGDSHLVYPSYSAAYSLWRISAWLKVASTLKISNTGN